MTVAACLAAASTSALAGIPVQYAGPTPYLSIDDAEDPVGDPGYCLEDFEDGTFDIPGATGNGSVVGGGANIDSVDGDDGAIDGTGAFHFSYFNGNGAAGLQIDFADVGPSGLPSRVGLVWTDGGPAAPVSFEAFSGDTSLGVYGPFLHADLSNNGETAEDRLYRITVDGEVTRVRISNTTGGIELDHLYINNCSVCGDANRNLRVQASDALQALKTSVGTDECFFCYCDTNASQSVTASDALAILRKSVGQSPPMNCPGCF